MSVELQIQDENLKCQIQTNILASVAPQMRDTIVKYIDSHSDWQNLQLDLSKVAKVDSIGINLIVGLYKSTEASKKNFSVINCQESVLKVLKLFRLQNHFSIEGSQDDVQ